MLWGRMIIKSHVESISEARGEMCFAMKGDMGQVRNAGCLLVCENDVNPYTISERLSSTLNDVCSGFEVEASDRFWACDRDKRISKPRAKGVEFG